MGGGKQPCTEPSEIMSKIDPSSFELFLSGMVIAMKK
jgi:hypothetical protein